MFFPRCQLLVPTAERGGPPHLELHRGLESECPPLLACPGLGPSTDYSDCPFAASLQLSPCYHSITSQGMLDSPGSPSRAQEAPSQTCVASSRRAAVGENRVGVKCLLRKQWRLASRRSQPRSRESNTLFSPPPRILHPKLPRQVFWLNRTGERTTAGLGNKTSFKCWEYLVVRTSSKISNGCHSHAILFLSLLLCNLLYFIIYHWWLFYGWDF